MVRCEPGRSFAFDVRAGGLRVARWAYDLEPTPTGCRVTETWTDQRGRLVTLLGTRVTGVRDRVQHVGTEIEHTLEAVKRRVEQAGP